MQSSNSETIATYSAKVQTYIDTSPQYVDGQLKVWIDDSLDGLDKGAKILEIGSGTGKDARYMSSKGYAVQVTDASQGFVDYLREEGFDARFLNAIEDDLGTDYDMVFAAAVFLNFTERELLLVLNKAFNALKPNGRLAFTLKAGEGEESTTRKMNGPRYFHFWQESEIKEMLKEVGFRDTSINSGEDFRGEGRPDWLHVITTR